MLAEKWQIRLFGEVSLNMAGREVTRFRTRKAGALLGYLAYNAGRSQPREMLLEMLWPENEIDSARNLLSVTLNSLRRQLEPPGVSPGDVLRTDRNSVSLNADAVVTDAARFKAEIREATAAASDPIRLVHLERALGYYGGEFMLGYYDQWIFTERASLEGLYVSALRKITRVLAADGELEQAIVHARKAAALDPLCESTCRELLRLLISTGRHCDASRQFELLRSALHESNGSSLEAETIALAGLIRGGGVDVSFADSLGSDASQPQHRSNRGTIQVQDVSVYSARSPITQGNLPLPLTRFFGRDSEIGRLGAYLSDVAAGSPGSRLITLTGPGGSGKTRLAIEIAKRTRDSFAGGAWFVPLADVSDSTNIGSKVRDSLGLSRNALISPLEQVTRLLGTKPALLILDNFEHLLYEREPAGANKDEYAALFVRDLIVSVPALICMITSRELLNIDGEQEFQVPPLETPALPPSAAKTYGDRQSNVIPTGITPVRLMQYSSVRLFVDRAQSRKVDFQVTQGNALAVSELCTRLDGLPLALELAAAWAQILTPAQMLERMANRFELLSSRARGVPERHRSLRAALDSSFRLLSPEQKQTLGRLALFNGGWTLELAEAMCSSIERFGGSDRTQTKVIDNLTRLHDASLIVTEEACGDTRYSLLESVRQFAAEQLTAEEKLAIAELHAQIFADFTETIQPRLSGPDQVLFLAKLELEYDNIYAALNWCLGSDAGAEYGLRMVGALQEYWFLRNRKEGRMWSNAMLAHPGGLTPSAARASALCTAVHSTPWGSDFTHARSRAEEGVQICRTLRLDSQLPASQVALAHATLNCSGPEVSEEHIRCLETMLMHALAQYEASGNGRGLLTAYEVLSRTMERLGDSTAARTWCSKALALCREASDSGGVARCLHSLAQLVEADGDWQLAYGCCEERLVYERLIGHVHGISHALYSRGSASLNLGDYAAALRSFQESLSLIPDRSEQTIVASHLFFIGAAALMSGQPMLSARILGAADRIWESHVKSRSPNYGWDTRWDGAIDGARLALGDAAFMVHTREGRELAVEQAIGCALDA